MMLRSLLFVPGDRPERFAKAAASGADALMIDLVNAVATGRKAIAREAVTSRFANDWKGPPRFLRINPLDGDMCVADIAALAGARPDATYSPRPRAQPASMP